jgi:hypothetical protein
MQIPKLGGLHPGYDRIAAYRPRHEMYFCELQVDRFEYRSSQASETTRPGGKTVATPRSDWYHVLSNISRDLHLPTVSQQSIGFCHRAHGNGSATFDPRPAEA